MRRGLRKRRVFDFVPSYLKGSVDRSLLPSAIFLIFTRNRPWMSEDHLSTLFFIETSKERLEKSERTPPVSRRPWALAYSRDRPYNLSCLSAMSKNGRLRSFSSALGCYLARKSLSWPAMLVSNKKQEFEQRKRIKLFDDFWVRAYRLDFSPRRRPRARSMLTVDFLAFNFRHLGRTAYLLASLLLLRFCYGFFIVFVCARATIHCYRFFNFDLQKKLCFIKADRVG